MPIQPVSGEIKAQPLNNNFSYLDSKTSNISKMIPSGTYATYADLKSSFPNGNSNIYVVSADGNWYYWDGANWVSGGSFATGENFAQLTVGKNLFDKSKATDGKYVLYTNGKLDNNPSFCVSDFIAVKPNTAYTKNDNQQFAFYATANQDSYLSGIASATTFTTPSGCYFVRISIRLTNKDIFQFELGTESTNFEPFGYFLKEQQLEPALLEKLDKLESPAGVLTVADSNGDVKTLNAGKAKILAEGGRTTMEVFPNDYIEVLSLPGNKNVDIVAKNKATTKLIDQSGDYQNCPLQVSGEGYFKGLTIIANHYKAGQIPDPSSYAGHIDYPGTGTLIFEDVDFESYQNSAVGVGMHQDQTIIFRRCRFYIDSTRGAAFYAHCNTESGITNQRLIMEDCVIVSELTDSIRLDDSNIIFGDGQGNDMTVRFINNYFFSVSKGKPSIVIYNPPISSEHLCGHIKLDPMSHGNNIDILNAY
ncbi:hypothetical protein FSZ06_05705 [Enterococcus gallinarum]|nr:hypothetical protein FSZ06_05705 [Enterococcus gallinarum]